VATGSNALLTNLNYDYTVEEFNEVCDYLKGEIPHLTIATDVICGLPGEEKNDNSPWFKDLVSVKGYPCFLFSDIRKKWRRATVNSDDGITLLLKAFFLHENLISARLAANFIRVLLIKHKSR